MNKLGQNTELEEEGGRKQERLLTHKPTPRICRWHLQYSWTRPSHYPGIARFIRDDRESAKQSGINRKDGGCSKEGFGILYKRMPRSTQDFKHLAASGLHASDLGKWSHRQTNDEARDGNPIILRSIGGHRYEIRGRKLELHLQRRAESRWYWNIIILSIYDSTSPRTS